MHSTGFRRPWTFDETTVATAIGAIAVFAIAAALIRIGLALRIEADKDAQREAELDDWAYSGLD